MFFVRYATGGAEVKGKTHYRIRVNYNDSFQDGPGQDFAIDAKKRENKNELHIDIISEIISFSVLGNT